MDVFVDEPRVPAELFALDNVVLLLAIRNLESYLDTGELVTPVLRPRRG
jgi:hypothetical protein